MYCRDFSIASMNKGTQKRNTPRRRSPVWSLTNVTFSANHCFAGELESSWPQGGVAKETRLSEEGAWRAKTPGGNARGQSKRQIGQEAQSNDQTNTLQLTPIEW